MNDPADKPRDERARGPRGPTQRRQGGAARGGAAPGGAARGGAARGGSPRRHDAPHRNPPQDAPSGPEGAPRLILGQNPVREAIRAHQAKVHEVLIEAQGNPRVEALERFAQDQNVTVRRVTRGELDRLAQGGRHQGVAAWAEALEFVDPEDLLSDPKLFVIALDGIVDPQNFGAVVRSAVGVAGAAVVFPENAAAPLTPTTFRASAGAVEHARLCRVRSLPAFLMDAQSRGVRIVGLAPDAQQSIAAIDFSGPSVLVVGSEEDGMAKATRRACTDLVKLTATNLVQSLNASVAAGIALYAASLHRSK